MGKLMWGTGKPGVGRPPKVSQKKKSPEKKKSPLLAPKVDPKTLKVGKYHEWTLEIKLKAMAVAKQTSIREAARVTGVSKSIIQKWLKDELEAEGTSRVEQQMLKNSQSGENKKNRKLTQAAREAFDEAREEVKDYLVDRLRTIADSLYQLAEQSVLEAATTMKLSDRNKDSAAWLRSVVGAMHYSLQDAQLLSGRPTARPEVMDNHEYNITQLVISDPEAQKLAEDLLVRASNVDSSMVRAHRKPWAVDALSASANVEQGIAVDLSRPDEETDDLHASSAWEE